MKRSVRCAAVVLVAFSFLVAGGAVAVAQSTPTNVMMDSLKALRSDTGRFSSVIESLHIELNKIKVDSGKVDMLNELSEMYWRLGMLDTALFFAENARIISNKNNYHIGESLAYLNIANIYYLKKDIGSSTANYIVSWALLNESKGIPTHYTVLENLPKPFRNYMSVATVYYNIEWQLHGYYLAIICSGLFLMLSVVIYRS